MRKQHQSIQLNCFSPPIMLATFIIEVSGALYSTWRYKLNEVGRIVVATLVFLGVFQLSEYFVCGGVGMSSTGWARVGYVSITMLPPLGLHLMHVLAGRRERKLVAASYFSAAAFIVYFLSYGGAFTGYQCTGNYVIFQLAVRSGAIYGAYYYGWLLTALALGIRWLKKMLDLTKSQRGSMKGLMIGYLVFLIPTAIANSVKPETRRGIPSIMCGFAVLFAIILVVYILPQMGLRRHAAHEAKAA